MLGPALTVMGSWTQNVQWENLLGSWEMGLWAVGSNCLSYFNMLYTNDKLATRVEKYIDITEQMFQ